MTSQRALPLAHNLLGAFSNASSPLWGIADQALVSASNFLVMVVLARQLGPREFGIFTVLYTVLLFVNSVHSAVFCQPHNIIGVARSPQEFRHYTTVTAWGQLAFSIGIGAVIAITGVGAALDDRSWGLSLAVLAVVSVWWQSQEFLRRVMYTRFDYRGSFANDLVSYGGQAVLIVFLAVQDSVSTNSALLTIGISSIAGCILGVRQLAQCLGGSISRTQVGKDLSDTWRNGRWLLASTLTNWVATQLYPVLTAGFVGAAATGGIRATQNLVAPTHVLTKTVDSIAPSRARQAFTRHGETALVDYLRGIGWRVGFAMAGFLVIASLFADSLVELLFGPEYLPYTWFLPVLGIAYMLTYIGSLAVHLLRAVESTAPIFIANTVTAMLVLTVGIWLVYHFGLEGAAVGLIGQSTILTVLLWAFAGIQFRAREQDIP